MILLASSPIDGVELVLFIALAIVTIMIAVASVVALVLRIKIFFSYWVTNRQRTSGGYTGEAAAKKLLAELGYDDIKVEVCGFFRMLLYSNHYNPNKKTIYLRRSVFFGSHLTAIGIALQKVGLAIQDKRNEAAMRRRWKLQKLSVFGSIFFIPIVLVGLVIDFVIMFTTGGEFISGIGILISAILGTVYFIVCLILSFMTVKVESKANRETLQIMKEHDFLSLSEQEKVAKVFKTYELSYICDFLLNILEIVKFILQIALTVYQSKDK